MTWVSQCLRCNIEKWPRGGWTRVMLESFIRFLRLRYGAARCELG